MKIVTHDAHFHADELLAVAALTILYPDASIVRSREGAEIASADIVVDVGRVYDIAARRFDHHQPGGAGIRENGIPYAALGLVWKTFGVELAGGIEEARQVEETLVMPIDALDNGVSISKPIFKQVQDYTVGDYFESFERGLESMEALEKTFFEILPLARELLKREINIAKLKVSDWQKVRKIYEDSLDKRVLVLPEAHSWKKVLISTETVFVVYPRLDGSWALQAVPQDEDHLFTRKVSMPQSWGGYGGVQLQNVSGVPDAIFCHRDLWLAAAESKEGALKLAELALNS